MSVSRMLRGNAVDGAAGRGPRDRGRAGVIAWHLIAGASYHLRISLRSYHHVGRLVPWPALCSPSHPYSMVPPTALPRSGDRRIPMQVEVVAHGRHEADE